MYNEIVNVQNIATIYDQDLSDIVSKAEKENLKPAVNDAKTTLLLVIDLQNDFMEGIGSLPVPGSKGDAQRLTSFMYNHMEDITQVMCSLDTHSAAQIFHPIWWKDESGNHPTPYTIITYDDVSRGKYKPIFGDLNKSLEYLKKLEENGKKQLCIWPYHCLEGSTGANLETEFTKMLYFHSVARKTKPAQIRKGTDAYSEMYGIIRPEYDENNFLNMPVLKAIEDFEEIWLAGEAASHCLLESGKQILEYFQNRPEVTSKITILEDCTSPIKGYEQETKDAFESFKATYGIKVMKSTDI